MACGEAFTNTQHFRRHSSWESILAERWQGAAEDSEEKGAPGRGAEDPRAAAGGFRRDWRQQEPTEGFGKQGHQTVRTEFQEHRPHGAQWARRGQLDGPDTSRGHRLAAPRARPSSPPPSNGFLGVPFARRSPTRTHRANCRVWARGQGPARRRATGWRAFARTWQLLRRGKGRRGSRGFSLEKGEQMGTHARQGRAATRAAVKEVRWLGRRPPRAGRERDNEQGRAMPASTAPRGKEAGAAQPGARLTPRAGPPGGAACLGAPPVARLPRRQ